MRTTVPAAGDSIPASLADAAAAQVRTTFGTEAPADRRPRSQHIVGPLWSLAAAAVGWLTRSPRRRSRIFLDARSSMGPPLAVFSNDELRAELEASRRPG